jgi:hypothetical protein
MPVSAMFCCATWVHMYLSNNFFQSDANKDSGEGVSLSHTCSSHETIWEFVLNVNLVVCRFKGHFSETD